MTTDYHGPRRQNWRTVTELIDTALELSHESWEPGAVCPNCSNDQLSRWVSTPEITRHENGYSTLCRTERITTVLAWECNDCDTLLSVSPVAVLLPATPGDLPDSTQQFQLETSENTVTTDWRWGEPCSACDSSFISERPVVVESVTSADGYA